MPTSPTKDDVLDAIKICAQKLGRSPSRADFLADSGMSAYHVLSHFESWSEAVRMVGLSPASSSKLRILDEELFEDWGNIVREKRQIPSASHYAREGKHSLSVFIKRIGPWAVVPEMFKKFAEDKPEWADVIALLPVGKPKFVRDANPSHLVPRTATSSISSPHNAKLADRQIYGNPIDFRGLRHEPVNENGVVFLFGMVARELGYSVEVVQAGFPDCEAKRQVGVNRWQRVRIEFEFESRNFREHGHPPEGCDIIVCWRHNWPQCPSHIEVIELQSIITMLAKTDS